jgi:Dolichyl-phosphate-mannose-protein mannosyltransferase
MATGSRAALRRALPGVGVAVAVAALVRFVYAPWYGNYDVRYALLWARDILHGQTPDYGAAFAPTPHPLSIAWSVIGLPFGDSGGSVMVMVALVGLGALVWIVFRLGQELFSPWVGAIAALVVLTRPAILRDALLGYQDVPFSALVIGAVLLEARKPKRGTAVLVLLGLAGLLRPEAWVLSGLYVLYLWRDATPRERWKLVALAAAAPLIWAFTDLLVTGDPLHSLHGTANLAEENGRRRKVTQVPRWTAQYVGSTLREGLILGVPVGFVFAWLYRRREAALPFAVIVAMLAVFAIGPIFGLPLIGRYVRTPAELMTLFFGLAVAGWLLLPHGSRERRWWTAIAALCVLVFAVFIPKNVTMLRGLHTRVVREGAFYRSMRAVAEAPRVKAAFKACAPLSAADHRPVPYLRYWLHGGPNSVNTVEKNKAPFGRVLVLPRSSPVTRRFYQSNFPPVRPPAGYVQIYANRSWRALARTGCTAQAPA